MREETVENPLHRRLGLRPGTRGLVVAAPENDDDPLAPLPEGCSVVARLSELASVDGSFDFIFVFARDRAELVTSFSSLRARLAPRGALWVAWMKSATDRRGSSLPTDLNENVVRRLALTNALVDQKLMTIDRIWSALKLAHRR